MAKRLKPSDDSNATNDARLFSRKEVLTAFESVLEPIHKQLEILEKRVYAVFPESSERSEQQQQTPPPPLDGQNVEIKARIADWDKMVATAAEFTVSCGTRIVQDDTFFTVSLGRLKLREFKKDQGELISYFRDDQTEAKLSTFTRFPVTDCSTLRRMLISTCGVHGRVVKTRHLFMYGQTRIHVDRVEMLGDFLELEVVLKPGQTVEEGKEVALDIMQKLGIEESELIAEAYVDLLNQKLA